MLNGMHATYWIDCGTLLGAHRDGDFLAHDKDVDLGVWGNAKHLGKAIRGALKSVGFEVWREFGTPERGFEQSFTRDGVKLDIFYFYPSDKPGKVWAGSWWDYPPEPAHLLVSEFNKEYVLEPQPYVFRGVKTFAPANIEGMLTSRYGDWRTPKEEWDWARDPECITPETRLKT